VCRLQAYEYVVSAARVTQVKINSPTEGVGKDVFMVPSQVHCKTTVGISVKY